MSGEKNVNASEAQSEFQENDAQDPPVTTPAAQLPGKAITATVALLAMNCYKYTYTTGPFSLPLNTHSLDWGVLNNHSGPQRIRVTVFRCNIGTTKTVEPPGPLEITLDPGETTHNANAAAGGHFYEIQIECNTRRIFPYASAWSAAIANPIPGSVVKSAEFIRRLR